MADTITFRPKPGVAQALDDYRGEESRSQHINAALIEYLGLDEDDDGDDE